MANRKRRGRPVSGVLVLDKPQGLGSNSVLQRVKHLYYARKAGHTGSLDPLATGVLPICFGEATKFSQFLLDSDKSYQTTVVLGIESNTEDADGELKFVGDTSAISRSDIDKAVESMRGDQMQVPPMYSALKHNGQRLYDLARQGIEVERAAREIHVHDIQVLDIRQNLAFDVDRLAGNTLVDEALVGDTVVDCAVVNDEPDNRLSIEQAVVCEVDIAMSVSKGTYVRSIAAEIGRKLNTGAHVKQLRRTQASVFGLETAVTLEHLETLKGEDNFPEMDELLQPIEHALPHLPDVVLEDNTSFYLRRGNPVQVPGSPVEGVVKLFLETGEFVGIGEIDDNGLVAPKRLVVVQD